MFLFCSISRFGGDMSGKFIGSFGDFKVGYFCYEVIV